MITESLAIELTKNLLISGQDEKPRYYRTTNLGAIIVMSDGRSKFFNRVEVEHARIMIGEKNES
jgi:hypothetical protein